MTRDSINWFQGYDRWLSNTRNLECNMEISSNNGSLYSFNCNYFRYKGTVWALYTNHDNRLVQIIRFFIPIFTNIQIKVQYLEGWLDWLFNKSFICTRDQFSGRIIAAKGRSVLTQAYMQWLVLPRHSLVWPEWLFHLLLSCMSLLEVYFI